jgi:hypothetical protein
MNPLLDPDSFPDQPEEQTQIVGKGSLDPDSFEDTSASLMSQSYRTVTQDPDAFAKVQDISQKTGLNTGIINRNPKQTERRANEPDWIAFESAAPKTAAKLATDVELFKLAHDDIENLTLIEQTLARGIRSYQALDKTKDIVKGTVGAALGPSFTSSAAGGGATAFALLSDYVGKPLGEMGILPQDPFAVGREWMLDVRRDSEKLAEEWKQAGDLGPEAQAALMGVESAVQMLPGLALSVAAGNPGPMLLWMSLITGGHTGGRALEAGESSEIAAVASAADMTAEYVTEKLPALWLLKDLKVGSSLFKTLFKQMAIEHPQEQLATLWQDFNDWTLLNQDKTLQEFVDERPMAAYQTAIAVTVGTGIQTTVGHVATKASGVYDEDQRLAREAQAYKEHLDDLAEKVGESDLRKRAPDQFSKVVDDIVGEDGDVYVNAKEFTEYFQEQNIDPAEIIQSLEGVEEQMGPAMSIDGNVSMKASDYLSKLATEYPDLSNIMRQDVGAMSAKESAEWQTSQPDNFKEDAERIEKEYLADSEFVQSADRIFDTAYAELTATGRYTDAQAVINAELPRNYGIAQADRLGIMPHEVYEQMGLSIQGEAVEGAQFDQAGKSGFEKVYRGEFTGNKGGSYYSPDREWARQFTQSGQDKEIGEAFIKTSDIYTPEIDIYAGDPDAIDVGIQQAKDKGFKAIRLDEGKNQPKSILAFDKAAIKSLQKYNQSGKKLADINLKEKVKMAKTGEVVEIEQSADTMLRQIDKRLDNLRSLIECLT